MNFCMNDDHYGLSKIDAEAYQAFHAEALRRHEEILRHGRVVPAEAMWAYLRARIAGENPAPPETVNLTQEELFILRASESFFR
jgi:hypothetical protein